MSQILIIIKKQTLIIFIVLISLVPVSCSKKHEIVLKTDILKYPSVTVNNLNTVYNDSGKVQLILSSPILEKYDNVDYPYTEFRSGITVIFYNGKKTVQGSVTSKYAKFNNTTKIWELKDSVVVVNQNNDKLETEVLNWNQGKDLIYTDRFVKMTSADEVMQGFGFESDTHLAHRKVKKVSAIIYLKDEE